MNLWALFFFYPRMVCSWRGLCNELKGRTSPQPSTSSGPCRLRRQGGARSVSRGLRTDSKVVMWGEDRIVTATDRPTPPRPPIFLRSLRLQEHEKQSRDLTVKKTKISDLTLTLVQGSLFYSDGCTNTLMMNDLSGLMISPSLCYWKHIWGEHWY